MEEQKIKLWLGEKKFEQIHMKYQDKIVLKGTTDFKSFPRPCILLMTAAKNVGVGLSTTQLTSGKMDALTKNPDGNRMGPFIPLSHFWISATCGENNFFYLVSLLEITRGQLLKGPHGIQLLGGLKSDLWELVLRWPVGI